MQARLNWLFSAKQPLQLSLLCSFMVMKIKGYLQELMKENKSTQNPACACLYSMSSECQAEECKNCKRSEMSAFIKSIHAKEHKLLHHAFCIYRRGHILWWLVEVNKTAMSRESNFHSHDPNQVKNFTKPYIYRLPSCAAVHGIFDIVCCSQNKVAVEEQLFASPLWIHYLDRSRIFSLKVTVFFFYSLVSQPISFRA